MNERAIVDDAAGAKVEVWLVRQERMAKYEQAERDVASLRTMLAAVVDEADFVISGGDDPADACECGLAGVGMLRDALKPAREYLQLQRVPPTRPARLDPFGLCKPRTRLVAHVEAGRRIVGAHGVQSYELRDVPEEETHG